MRVISYYKGVPTKNRSQEKFDVLVKFIQGVKSVGDSGDVYQGYEVQPADVGFIQGWQHESGKTAPHLKLRQAVIDTQINQGKYVCCADANLFVYATEKNKPHHYLRYSFNGVFPNTGIYFDDNPDPSRWRQISNDLNIKLEADKRNGKHILVCVQRAGGWSMGKKDLGQWCLEVVNDIRRYSDRPIVLRLHPGDKKTLGAIPPAIKQLAMRPDITLSPSTKHINEDLKNCWAVVNHNSSSIVAPLIQGYPAFITDPIKSQCAEVSHKGFRELENPSTFDRLKWLERISMFHWKFSELENGSAWKHMRKYVNG
jgi:hypothetical protein